MDWEFFIWLAIGYFVSLFFGHIATSKIVNLGWSIVENNKNLQIRSKYQWATVVIGHIDRILFTTSIVFGVKEFIAAWLAVRIVSQWSKWGSVKESPQSRSKLEKVYQSRALFQIFLIGTAVSLVYGVLGGQMVIWMVEGDFIYAIIALITALALSLMIYIYINSQKKQKEKIDELNRAP
jgi:hypothetical protein